MDGGDAWVLDMVAVLEGNSPEDSLIFRTPRRRRLLAGCDQRRRGTCHHIGTVASARGTCSSGSMIAEPYVGSNAPPVSTFGPEGDYLLYGDGGIRTFNFDPEPLIEAR